MNKQGQTQNKQDTSLAKQIQQFLNWSAENNKVDDCTILLIDPVTEQALIDESQHNSRIVTVRFGMETVIIKFNGLPVMTVLPSIVPNGFALMSIHDAEYLGLALVVNNAHLS